MTLLKKVAASLQKVLFPVSTRLSDVGMGVLMVMVLLVVVDVLLRRLFNMPLAWSYEVVEIMLAVVVFFTMAYCGIEGHLSINVLVSRFSPKARARTNAITSFLSILLLVLIGWRSAVQAMHVLDIGHVTGIIRIPYYPFILVAAFGSIVLALVVLVHLLNYIVESLGK